MSCLHGAKRLMGSHGLRHKLENGHAGHLVNPHEWPTLGDASARLDGCCRPRLDGFDKKHRSTLGDQRLDVRNLHGAILLEIQAEARCARYDCSVSDSVLNLDVAVLGGGLAGNFLLRQLRQQSPTLRTALFEKSEQTSYKIGESTVEVASSYFVRRQRLLNYLFENHLPKNGLRFFFDNQARNASLFEMSELGTEYFPKITSFQLDRSTFEKDLWRMNREEGADLRTGVAVRDLKLGQGNEPHRFVAQSAHGHEHVAARWVVDCSGRAQVLAKQRGLRQPIDSHRVVSAWGRFRGVADVDTMGDEAWRQRVRYTSRRLSTMHFCYEGYWFWLIPLRGGVTSIGVVAQEGYEDDAWRKEAGFVEFLSKHAALGRLTKDAELIDFGAYRRLAYGTERFYSTERWAAIGDAAAFPDPFYSPGSDLIALGCDFVSDLVQRDSEDDPTMEARVAAYETFMQNRFAQSMVIYQDQYPTFGSYDIMRIKLPYELNAYYNFVVRPYLLGDHLDLEQLARTNAMHDSIIAELSERMELFSACAKALKESGLYHRNNRDAYRVTFDAVIPFIDEMGVRVKEDKVAEHRANIAHIAQRQAERLLKNAERLTADAEPRA